MNIEELYNLYKEFSNICIDTRNTKENSIFFALKGDNFNGNKFAEQALNLGCSYAVVDEKEFATRDNIILVENVLDTLQELSKLHRATFKIPIIGITGTNGKTTTKELINAVLKTQYNSIATQGNLNNHIGVPLSLLKVNAKHEIAIIEMGANHVGEIKFLCGLADPDYGIITNVGKAHLEGFGSFENIIKTKTEIYENIKLKNGKIFINKDNSILVNHSKDIDQITYGTLGNEFVSAELIENTLTLSLKYNDCIITTQLIGNYNFENALAAIAIGSYFGISDANIKTALENYIPTINRSQLIKKDSNTLIMDAYNANPVSMQAAIDSLSKNGSKNKIAILGDMRELGNYSKKEHQIIVEQLKTAQINTAYLVGEEFSKIDQNSFKPFSTTEDLKIYLSKNKIENSTILIKGSRGIKLESILDVL